LSTANGRLDHVSQWSQIPLRLALQSGGRWLYLIALPVAMLTPRITLDFIHLTVSDVLALLGGACWIVSMAVRVPPTFTWGGAKWPAIVVIAGIASVATSVDRSAVVLGVGELAVLWILPALAVPNLFDSPAAIDRALTAISLGSVAAAVINLWTAASIGFENGIPQVWGPADYFQGYFQVMGVGVAAPRLMAALAHRRMASATWFALALAVNAGALLVTQTRGAWLAGAAVFMMIALLSRRPATLGIIALVVMIVLLVGSSDWAQVLRERAQSIFSFEARLTGFDSSLIRLALLLTAWRMFLAHPLVGIGLKNFPIVAAAYGPAGLPDAIEMGPNHVLTPIEGPHSTYIALLAEAGVVAAAALIAWEVVGVRRLYSEYRRVHQVHHASRVRVISLMAGVLVVSVFNCFSEMNATGALPLVYFLSLASARSVGEGSAEHPE
jgi:O-antigen ligase